MASRVTRRLLLDAMLEEATKKKERARTDRMNMKSLSVHVPENMYWQLKMMAVEKRVGMQDIVGEAINTFFKIEDKPMVPLDSSAVDAPSTSSEPASAMPVEPPMRAVSPGFSTPNP